MAKYRIVCNGTSVVWEGDTLANARKELVRTSIFGVYGGDPCPYCRIQRNEATDCESVGEWSQLSPKTGRWSIV